METIRVNMTPCEDIKTIHASQNDNEGREWGFELHNNGEKIDSSSISDQLVFKAYEGGTEQILPENGSTPTTSPFKGDIKYPQGLLTDQEFLYRESPTEEDGLAKITSIKGNTLGWNQLVQNGNFESIDGWGKTRITLSASNNVLTATVSEASTGRGQRVFKNLGINDEHTRLYTCEIKATSGTKVNLGSNTVDAAGYTILATDTANGDWQKLSAISSLNHAYIMVGLEANTSVGDTYQIRNVQVFDLTQMGLDITDPSDFTSLFSLPYYAYNQGTLLSFMGNGIKTVGFNQWDEEWEAGILNNDGSTSSSSNRIITSYVPVLPNITYSMTIPYNGRGRGAFYDANKHLIEYFGDFPVSGRDDVFPRDGLISSAENNYYFSFIPPVGTAFVRYNSIPAYGATYENNICINISDSSKNGTYEPYTSSTLSLPISTYFPTGMKSAGNVYDELTPTKAITRIGRVDLGTLNWIHRTEVAEHIFSCDVTNSVLYKRQLYVNFEIAKYNNGGTVIGVTDILNKDDKTVCLYFTTNIGNRYIYIKDSSFSDATALKNSLNGTYLYFELETPTETSFTTASLVTENAEIPLSNEDGVLIGKCNEQLSSESGFIDAKIKLSDSDGECYSNKIQLHVERSPQ